MRGGEIPIHLLEKLEERMHPAARRYWAEVSLNFSIIWSMSFKHTAFAS